MSPSMFDPGATETLFDRRVYTAATETLYGGPNASTSPYPAMAGARSEWIQTANLTSTDMSSYLLETYNDQDRGDRYGAYIFGDALPVNITVDYQWLQANREEIFAFGELVLPSGDIALGPVNFLVPFNQEVYDAIGEAGAALLFPTLYEDFNGSDMQVSWDSSTVNAQARTIKVENAVVTSADGHAALPLGNQELDLNLLFELMPAQGKQSFAGQVPLSDYTTILHNSTAVHALPAFNAELTELALRACLSNSTMKLAFTSHPLPPTAREAIEVQVILSFFTSLFILIPLCYAPA
ncbi:unnamed protein product, partial [Chrysoparadoxa australica]